MSSSYPQPKDLSLSARQAKVAQFLAVPDQERQELQGTIEKLRGSHPDAWQEHLTDRELISAAKLGYPTYETIERKLAEYQQAKKQYYSPALEKAANKLADAASTLALIQKNQRLMDAARPLANPDLVLMKAAIIFPAGGASEAIKDMLTPVHTRNGVAAPASAKAIRAAGVYTSSIGLLSEAEKRGAPMTTRELDMLKQGAQLRDSLGDAYRSTLKRVEDRFEASGFGPQSRPSPSAQSAGSGSIRVTLDR